MDELAGGGARHYRARMERMESRTRQRGERRRSGFCFALREEGRWNGVSLGIIYIVVVRGGERKSARP